ncbi:MAG TPA: thioredoxin domain-containing protein [Patescibacteria group bacterium]|nr:thioredoxin domain-containing protein [Patescibacteria group bacterium]
MPRAIKKKPLTIGDVANKVSAIPATQLLYSLLLVATFMIGYLVARVQSLENPGSVNAQANTIAQQALAKIANNSAADKPAQIAQDALKQIKETSDAAPTQAPAAAAAAPQQPQAPDPSDVLKNLTIGHFPAKGDPNAKVKVIEFADFRCPFCEQFFTNTETQLLKDYADSGKIAFYFRQYAFLGPASVVAANAAECANEQGKFWDMHDWLYKNQPSETDTSMYNTDDLTNAAGTLGMDTTQFRDCLSSNKYGDKVTGDMTEGQKVGTSGTPTFYINGKQLVGAVPYDNFKQMIDAELK